MERLTVDPQLQARLGNLEAELELCDESGRTLGYFLPAEGHVEDIYAWADTQIPREELERRRQEPGGRTTAEVLERLRGE